jgi:hypothetical protein
LPAWRSPKPVGTRPRVSICMVQGQASWNDLVKLNADQGGGVQCLLMQPEAPLEDACCWVLNALEQRQCTRLGRSRRERGRACSSEGGRAESVAAPELFK